MHCNSCLRSSVGTFFSIVLLKDTLDIQERMSKIIHSQVLRTALIFKFNLFIKKSKKRNFSGINLFFYMSVLISLFSHRDIQ